MPTPETADWFQAGVHFAAPDTAEHLGTRHLAPALADFAPWFLVRKDTWRCRVRLPPDPDKRTAVRRAITLRLDGLATAGVIGTWVCAVYEPEIHAFGGAAAMRSAHTLFCADTAHALAFLTHQGPERDRRREISLLLCRILMRAAGLDHYEQGDVWARVAATRSPPIAEAPRLQRLHHQVHRLLSVDPDPQFAPGAAFARYDPWARAFAKCGHELADLNAQGQLGRGLRSVIAHHVIFHWNRLGVPAAVQGTLSHTATRLAFDPEAAAP